jgi:multidrug efflux system outer membrane protein
MTRGIILSIALCLSGCYLVGPDYHKPQVPVPQTWRFSPETSRQTVNTYWWQQFGDPEMNRLVDRVLANNLDVKMAYARLEQFAGVYRTTRSSLFPQLSGGGVYNRQQISGSENPFFSGVAPDTDYARIGATAIWQLDIWGQLRRANEAAFADLMAQQYARDTVLLTVVSSAAQTYIQLRTLDAILDITRQIITSLEEQDRINQKRFEMGYTSQLEVSQSRSELERRKALIPQYEQQIAQAEHALSVLLGANPMSMPRGKPLYEIARPAIPAGLPSDLLLRRPDIQQAEQTLIAANARIGVARGEYFPKIQLTGDIGQASTELASLFVPGANFWTIGTKVIGPIFTAGKIAGQVQAAEAEKRLMLNNYQKTIINGFREFEDALVSHKKTLQQIEALSQRVTAVGDYMRLSQLRYDEGYVDYISLLDAQRQFYEARTEQAQAFSAHLVAAVNLYKSMGGGWVVASTYKTPDAYKHYSVKPYP